MDLSENEQRHILQLARQLAEQLGGAAGVTSFLEAAIRSEQLVVKACAGRPELHDLDTLPKRPDFREMVFSPTLNGLIGDALTRKANWSPRPGWGVPGRPNLLRGIAEAFWDGDRRSARESEATPRQMLLGMSGFFLRQLRSKKVPPATPEAWRSEAAALRSSYPAATIAHALAWRHVMRSTVPLGRLLEEQLPEIEAEFARARDSAKKTSQRKTRIPSGSKRSRGDRS